MAATLQGLLADPAFMMGTGLLSTNGRWQGGLQGLIAAQGYKLSEERLRIQAEQEARQKLLEELQLKAAQDAQARQQWSQTALSSIGGLDPKYQQMYQQDPAFQQALRAKSTAFGDPAALEAGGLLQPLQKPVDAASLLSAFTPASVKAYQASPTHDIGLLQRNPPQATPPQPLTERDLLDTYTPESVKKWRETGDISVLQIQPPKPTAADTTKQHEAITGLAETQNAAQQLRKTIMAPSFPGSVGLIDQYTAAAGAKGVNLFNWGEGTEQGMTNRLAASQVSELLTKTIKTLGANPSDADLKMLRETMPQTGDSDDYWVRWYNEQFVPKINARARMTPGIEQDIIAPITPEELDAARRGLGDNVTSGTVDRSAGWSARRKN